MGWNQSLRGIIFVHLKLYEKAPDRYFFSMKKFVLGLILFLFSNGTVALADNFADRRAAAIKNCQAIRSTDFQSGLWLNPEGYRSFYIRSECFQRAAEDFRDATLCDNVRERRDFFSSSWGYSKRNCLQLVRAKFEKDRASIEAEKTGYAQGPVRLTDFMIVANGNGKDFDIKPVFSAGYAHGYHLDVTLIDPQAHGKSALIHSLGYYLNGQDNILIYLPTKDIYERFPQLSLDRPYTVRVQLTCSAGSSDMNEVFINDVWPDKERSQTLTKIITLSLPQESAGPGLDNPK